MTPIEITSLSQLDELDREGKLVGRFIRMSDELYHDPTCLGVSSSTLKNVLRSPAHAEAMRSQPFESPALQFGKLVHMAVLEPERFAEECVVSPKFDRRTTAGKAGAEAFERESMGKQVITDAMYLDVISVRSAVNASSFARKHLSGGTAELSIFWKDKDTGILCKARFDYLKSGLIVDLKTTYDASPKSFGASVAQYNYGLSAAFYLDGARSVGHDAEIFAWIAVEKKVPFGVAFYTATQDVLMAGRAEYQQALRVYKQCLLNGVWPGYPEEFQAVSMPSWDEEIQETGR